MKKLLGFIILAIALILGGYFGMGMLTERAIKKNIDVLNQTNGVNITLESYQRGLFRSHAMLVWKVNINDASTNVMPNPLTVNIPLNIDHGPIIFSNGRVLFGLGHAGSTVVLPLQDAKALAANSITPTLNLSVFVSYFNKTKIDLVVPKFDMVTNQGNMHFDSKGMDVQIHISASRKQIQGAWFVDSSTWAKDKVQIAFDQIKSTYYLNLTHKGLAVGDASVNIPYLSIAQSGNKVLEIKNMVLQSKNGIDKALFHASLKADVDSIVLNKKTYSASELALDIKNLDANVLVQINNNLSKIDQSNPSAQQQMMFSLLSDFPNLVNKGAEVQLSNFNVITPEGPINASASLIFPSEAIANPFQLIQKIKGTAKINISTVALKALMKNSLQHQAQTQTQGQAQVPAQAQVNAQPVVDNTSKIPEILPQANPQLSSLDIDMQAEQRIQSLVKAGMLVLNGDTYSSELVFKDGNLTVNGKAFSPSMLQ